MRTIHRNRWWKKIAVLLLPAVIAAGGLAACSSSSASTSHTSYTLRVGFIGTTPDPSGPEGWANQNGSLLKGLKGVGVQAITWSSFKNGPDLSAAMTDGSLDIGLLGDTPAIDAKGSGVDTRLVNQDFIGLDTWLYTAKGGPTTLAGLVGKTVATQVGSYMYRYLVELLDQQGLTGKVKITHIYTQDAVASLKSGGIAAYAAPAGQLTNVLTNAGFSFIEKASDDHKDLLGSSVTVITSKALAAHPDLPAAWNTARASAVADINAHADAYYAFASKATQTPAPAIQQSQPVTGFLADPFTPDGLKLLGSTKDFLVQQKLATKDFAISDWQVGG